MPGAEPVANLARRVPTSLRQDLELAALKEVNDTHRATRLDDPQLATRIKAFETAHGMQTEMPAALDLAQESDDTLAMYGLTRGQNDGFGWQCLAARRLVERLPVESSRRLQTLLDRLGRDAKPPAVHPRRPSSQA